MQLIVSIDKIFQMAKILVLASLLLYITVAEGVDPVAWNRVGKFINTMESKLTEAFDGVIAAAPEANRSEVEKVTLNHILTISLRVGKAQEQSNEEEAMRLIHSYEEVAAMITAAPPSKKFQVMEGAFIFVNAPDYTKCPTVDKLYCETTSKIKTIQEQFLSTTPPAKESEVKKVVQEKVVAASAAINKAYASVDDRQIAEVLAAYNKAADAVIAAAPAEKLKAMEKAFTAAEAAAAKSAYPRAPEKVGPAPAAGAGKAAAATNKAEEEWSAAANKSISAMQSKVDKAFRDAVLVAPPAKIPEVEKEALGQMIKIGLLLADAKGTLGKGTRDEKQAISIAEAYEKAADLVIAAPPAEKLKVMEEAFKEAAKPKHA